MDFDKDLIHFDPRYLSNVNWWHIRPSVFLSLFDEGPSHERLGFSFIGSNIAMDYDPSIMDTLKKRPKHYRQKGLGMSSGDFRDMISYLRDLAKVTIWFIDYRLVQTTQNARISKERKGEASGQTQEDRNVQVPRELFRSDDFIYTEVKREDIGTSWVVSNDEVNSRETETAFDMFDALLLDDDDLDHLRVLACEPVAGRTP
jgi:hypothetical protein